jgi:hypothetical protein
LAEIIVMNADGSNQRSLFSSSLIDTGSHPAWSPDGTKIAFSESANLYVMNADGSGQRTVGPLGSYQPAWSPDGSRLAVTNNQGGIYVMSVDGSQQTLLTSGYGDEYDDSPAWSPDSSKIVFAKWAGCDAQGDCEDANIWTINADGSNPTQLAQIPGFDPTWSPDGTKIVFAGSFGLTVMNSDGSGIMQITNSRASELSPSWQPVPLPPPSDANPIDDPQFFVHQQYADFLNREPDADGQTFWTNQIMACSGDPGCVEAARVNDSGAFFLSIEFQQTGYQVYRMYKAAYGNLPDAPVPVKFSDFLADTKQISNGVAVLQPGWESVLENNKQAFTADFVQRAQFTSAFPSSLGADQFVDALNKNAGDPLSQTERDQLVSDLSSGAKSRGNVLREIAENPQFVTAEFNRAFVLAQYFGYLRRDPNAGPDTDFSGYNFWLDKLNTFNGDFVQAEMVKAFIEADEYRRRFAH